MDVMKLTKTELEALKLLAGQEKLGFSEIGAALCVSRSSVSQLISSLKEKNLARVSRKGIAKTAFLSEAKHAALYRRLVLEFDHVDFRGLLSGSGLEVLSAISCLRLKNRSEIAGKSLVSEASVAKTMKKFSQIGIVLKDSTYHISPRFQTIRDFVAEFRHFMNTNIALGFARDSLIVWECNHEFIIESSGSKMDGGFLPTAASTFSKYGVQLLISKWHYFHSPFVEEIKLEDAILHSILTNKGGNLTPTLLVWRKNDAKMDIDYLTRESEKYGVENYIANIMNYFKTQGVHRPLGFPPWSEFQDKAKEYEIS